MADSSDLQNRLTGFSHDYLQRDGNMGLKKIHKWHLADDVPVPSGVSGTYPVYAEASGQIESITFLNGLCVSVETYVEQMVDE
jgi:hypothetical protein